MQETPRAFRLPFWAVVWMLGMGNLIGLICFIPPVLIVFIKEHRIVMVSLICGLTFIADSALGWVLVFLFRHKVWPDRLRGFNIWGIPHTVSWSEVHEAKPFNFLGLRFLRLFFRDARFALWVPLFLVDQPGFARTISQYAPEANPLRQQLELHQSHLKSSWPHTN